MMPGDALQEWYRTPLGQLVAAQEREVASEILRRYTPGFVLQIGGQGGVEPLPVECAVRRWIIDDSRRAGPAIQCWHEDLPLRKAAVDAVVLMHCLEFEPNPHQVLREAVRVLEPEGILVIIAFNPLSFWGLRRAAGGLGRADPPWCGHFYSRGRLHDWCKLMGLEPREHRRLFFRPPVQGATLQRRLRVLDRIGPRLWPWFGGVHMQVGCKHVARVIPMGAMLRARSRLPGRATAAPGVQVGA